MNDWSCCNPAGKCEQGPGCPAGGACHSMPGCADTQCPGHPGGAKVAKVKRQYKVSQPKTPVAAATSRAYLKYLARAMLMFLAVAGVCAVAVSLIPREAPKSDCAKLMQMWGGNPPAHVRLRCASAPGVKP